MLRDSCSEEGLGAQAREHLGNGALMAERITAMNMECWEKQSGGEWPEPSKGNLGGAEGQELVHTRPEKKSSIC